MAGEKAGAVKRMPGWMRQPIRYGDTKRMVEGVLDSEGLNTVCAGARCPNAGECFSAGTATFMILGDQCTRECGFCAVSHGPVKPPDEDEPGAVARAARSMGLNHVVVTSVTRDDLADGGAEHFARTIAALRETVPEATVEVLVPDFRGDERALGKVMDAGPDVFNHNVETVRRLYPRVRPQADYDRSLWLMSLAREAGMNTKSGFMVGLGEKPVEVEELLGDLDYTGCSLVTIGQYLRPTGDNLQVERYWTPDEFRDLEQKARAMGFEGVAAGPLVRSSYRAAEMIGSQVISREDTGHNI